LPVPADPSRRGRSSSEDLCAKMGHGAGWLSDD